MSTENEQHETPTPRTGLRRMLPRRGTGRTRAVLVGTGVLAFGIAPLTYAATGGSLTLGERNSANDETEVISSEAAGPGAKGGYATRQSNLSSSGGGAIYGCRSTAKTSASDEKNPCIRANNLATGLAFEFRAGRGTVGGDISVANGGDGTKPFTTNATGVATGLNADRVDGINGSDITAGIAAANSAAAAADAKATAAAAGIKPAAADRWVRVASNADGTGATITAQSGGFSLVNCYQANGNCYIDAGEDLSKRQVSSEILTTNGGSIASANLAGSSSSSPCILDSVLCAPAGTEAPGVFVVTPRNADGTAVTAGQRKFSFTATVNATPAG